MLPHDQRLLVITDGSPRDADVLYTAAQLLRPHGVVTLLRVVAPPVECGDGDDLLPAVDRAEHAALDALGRQTRAFGSARTERVVLVGADAEAEIAAWIEMHPVAAVVLPARARRGLGVFWPGRRESRLARLGNTPVITVYPAPEARTAKRATLPAA